MAGAGWKDFIPGAVLTAQEVQDYLQDQSVMRFASSAARGSAIASPTEGMISYITATDLIEVYNGSAWKQLGATTGGILQVVSAEYDTAVSTTSSSFVTSGLSASITPKSTSNKVLVTCSTGVSYDTRTHFGIATIFRGTVAGTDLGDPGGFGFSTFYPSTAASNLTNFAATVLDSPNTTSSQTYTLGIKTTGGGTIAAQAQGTKGVIVLIEVAG